MDMMEYAKKARLLMEKAAQILSDTEAFEVKTLYPRWEKLVQLGSVTADAGYRFYYAGDLYKCVNANPTFRADWVPGVGTESLYVRIDETHAGTLDNPIPYSGNMELTNGLYYSQGGVVYRCIRDTRTPVYHALKDLVGLYVEEVSVDADS